MAYWTPAGVSVLSIDVQVCTQLPQWCVCSSLLHIVSAAAIELVVWSACQLLPKLTSHVDKYAACQVIFVL